MTTSKQFKEINGLVGFGDFYPKTGLGRITIFFCSMVGVVVVSMVVVSVINLLSMSSLESKAYTIIKKLQYRSEVRDKAASVIGKFSRLYLDVRKRRGFKTKNIFDFN